MKRVIRLTESGLVKLIKRVINEGEDEELDNLFEISKSDLELAKIMVQGYNMTLEELYDKRFGHLRNKLFNSCEEMDCKGIDFSFEISFMEYSLDRQKPLIYFEVRVDKYYDIGKLQHIVRSILKKYCDGVEYFILIESEDE